MTTRLPRRRFLGLLVGLALALPACHAGRARVALALDDDARIHVIVLHTNDLHGQVLPRPATWTKADPPPLAGGLPRIAAAVNRVWREAESNGAALLVVDGGDWTQGTPEGALDDGLGFASALAAIGYDALCVGNHELDRGLASLQQRLSETHLPAVCANLEERDSGRPVEWVPPYRIVERGGLRIALVGLLTPATPSITHRDARTLRFVASAKALARVRAELAGAVDWVLPLTHLGVDDDRALARAHADLPLIVGGHSHTVLHEGVREGGTLIVQAGAKASALGRVDLWFDASTKRCVEARASLIELLEEPAAVDANAAVQSICDRLIERSDLAMREVVAELAIPLTRGKDPFVSSTAGNWITDALREHARADVAIMNRGGIRSDVAAGPLTRRALFELSPFENAVSTFELTGADLERVVARFVKSRTHSGMEISGVVVRLRVPRHGATGARVLDSIEVGGKPLDRDATYRLVTNSFLADGGDTYFEAGEVGNRVDDPLMIREALELVAKKQGRIEPDATNRYVTKKR
ncbi:MAG: bifunctional metallophosphatase/5'-nucleotidase [Planctomycetota bacterium]